MLPQGTSLAVSSSGYGTCVALEWTVCVLWGVVGCIQATAVRAAPQGSAFQHLLVWVDSWPPL